MSHSKVKRYGSGINPHRIYCISPRHPENLWSLQGLVDIFGTKSLMPNPAFPLLMALTPPHVTVEYSACDENVAPADMDTQCDLVAITGSTLHAKRIHELCAAYRGKGIPVALGGSYATLEADKCAGISDYHFIGEAEYTWPKFLEDWTSNTTKSVYLQKDYVDLHHSPAPDWALVDPNHYVNINIQTSRGCPNNCDFCEVVQYNGKIFRTKSVEQVMVEVENAHTLGARSIFFSDDNFMGNKKFTRELLERVIDWNVRQERPLSFSTQITIQIADDEKLLRMMADARFSVLFIGIESIKKECLEEVNKRQNIVPNISDKIQLISRYGIVPFPGFIVGFDNDDLSIFNDLFAFLAKTACPIAGISLLNAPRSTPLYRRLKRENRIIDQNYSGEHNLTTNIIPRQMSRDELFHHYVDLYKKLYKPGAFEERLFAWFKLVDYFPDIYKNKKIDPKFIYNGYKLFSYFLFQADPMLRSLFCRSIPRTWKINRRLMKKYFTLMSQYSHFYDFSKKLS